jgi:hypothetical protein
VRILLINHDRFIAIDEGQITSLVVAPRAIRETLHGSQDLLSHQFPQKDLDDAVFIVGDSMGKIHVFENSAVDKGGDLSSPGWSINDGHSRTASAPQARVGRPMLQKSSSLHIDLGKAARTNAGTKKLQGSPPPGIRRRGSFSKTLDGAVKGEASPMETHFQPRTIVKDRERGASEPGGRSEK